jgi:hypothetical protein
MVCGVAFGAIVLVWHSVMRPWWDNAGDIQEMIDNQRDGIGNEGVDEYVPSTVDSSDVDQNAPQVRFVGSGAAKVQVIEWGAEDKIIDADASSRGKLVLKLFNYRDWKVDVNGTVEQSETAPHTGLMEIPIRAGTSRVHITWAEGWDRKAGGAISIITLAGVLACSYASRRSSAVVRSAA